MNFENLQRGVIRRPMKIVLTGVEGVGKTTFGAGAPGVIFADLEQGSSTLDVTRFPDIETWSDMLEAIGFLFSTEHDFETLVVDSMSVAERLAGQKVAQDAGAASIEDIAYGKGHAIVGDEIDSFLRGMDALISKGMNVILICHSVVTRFDDPAGDSYDTYDIALGKRIAPRIRQWGDFVLFADHDKSTVKKGDGFNERVVAKSYGDRIMWTEHRASHGAKNRIGLPEKMPLDWPTFSTAIDDFYNSAQGIK